MRYYIDVDTIEQARSIVKNSDNISLCAFQSINFNKIISNWDNIKFTDCLFIGCTLPSFMLARLDGSNTILSDLNVPYQTFRTRLYDASTLYDAYNPNIESSIDECYDAKVYKRFLATGKRANNINETLARTLHDHSMSDAMHDFLANYREEDIVAIMGGHALLRSDKYYRDSVYIAKLLTEKGKIIVSGGGPGAMEASHVGAWLAGRDNSEVEQALTILQQSISFDNPLWLKSAFEVINTYPQAKYVSLGVPTWLYGHEPATPFATHIAKYFDNALREDHLLTIAKGGVIYTPGSAGTMQEIFQDAAQNHYISFGYASPMVFLGTNYWSQELPAYSLLQDMAKTGRYKNLLLSISDNIEEIINSIMNFTPKSQSI